ncbi:uncharacterized protein LOC135711471 [Ochlerotatus camptorhynchus]|uniref:uncharacterized protein LOC135711471 n=1 Tax=Ochlerotatus camptorhynchus TaxID=644619 RepID=UPI0031E2CB26
MVTKVLTFLAVATVVTLQLVAAQLASSCIASSCKTYQDINTLWCHSDPTYFCQCRTDASGKWVEQVMPCSRNGTLFSFRRQTCVHEDQWDRDECSEKDNTPVMKEELEIASCSNPCTTYEEISRLWCHPEDRKLFCQCRPTEVQLVFRPVRMPCASGTSFSFQRQTCMHDAVWTNSCSV